jgi:prepilin-type N-terminal cleavage/methylation domain-containing protein
MRKEKGFTLVELLVAMAISGIVVAAVYTAFVTQQKSYTVQNQVAETQQNARVGLDLIAREVRMAGYGQPAWSMNADTDGGCFGLCHTVTDPVTVVDGGGSPDRITVIGCFDTAPPTLSQAVVSGAITLKVTDAGVFDNTNNKDSIFIGGFENAKVTNKSGTTLTIDTDPDTSGNQGLVHNYDKGTEVNPVRAVTYYVEDDTLRRNENTTGGGQPLAENIEDLQITYANKIANISVLARSREIDPTYRDATHGDHYRRRTLISNVNVRSLLYQVEEE